MYRPLAGRLLAHRGLWTTTGTPNSLEALVAAAEHGFGIETDIRDSCGNLVISHDPAGAGALDAASALRAVLAVAHSSIVLALNVKADGLEPLLDPVLDALASHSVFFFDMSVPQLLSYSRLGLPVAVRVSEYEPLRAEMFAQLRVRKQIWLDAFDSDWWLDDPQIAMLASTETVVVVSPELHGRDPERVWDWFIQFASQGHDVLLCTDEPQRVLETAR